MFHRFEALRVLNFCVLQVSQALGVETLSAPASEGRVSMGIRVFSHARIYEKLAVYQRVGLVSIVLRLRPEQCLQPRVYLGIPYINTFCAMTFGTLPRLHFMQRGHAVPRLFETCRDIV